MNRFVFFNVRTKAYRLIDCVSYPDALRAIKAFGLDEKDLRLWKVIYDVEDKK